MIVMSVCDARAQALRTRALLERFPKQLREPSNPASPGIWFALHRDTCLRRAVFALAYFLAFLDIDPIELGFACA